VFNVHTLDLRVCLSRPPPDISIDYMSWNLYAYLRLYLEEKEICSCHYDIFGHNAMIHVTWTTELIVNIN
jgi:hypothetical protein